MRLDEFDGLPADEAEAALLACCASPGWARRVAAGRRYGHLDALLVAADAALTGLDEAGVDAALAGHPRIGERMTRASSHASSRASSQREQAAVAGADAAVVAELAAGNRAYEERFGHVYLVCADGRGAPDLLAALRARLDNDPATERRVLREELRKINAIRLRRMVGEP